jgi:lysophospholipase L1-like esterase
MVATVACLAGSVGLGAVNAGLPAICELRDGLPNAGAKLARGEKLKVVFIGGSITRGGGADGYVAATERWLRAQWPTAEITVVNAGISGTDSGFGAKRYDRDVLVHRPDLVLIEFAVNDGQMDHTADVERMVHKTWRQDPQTDIVIFHTLAKGHLEDYQAGRQPVAAAFHERVAAHYGIPTLGLAQAVAAKIQAGEITWEQFANDGCHPHAGGYALFNATLQEALPRLFAVGQPGPHTLKAPLTADLQVYPPAIEVKPLAVPPFVDGSGRPALASYSLPVPAWHWIGEPDYADETGKPLWRLHWLAKAKTAAMDAQIGLAKGDWGENLMTWFEEDRSFTGPEGNALFSAKEENRPCLGFSGQEAAVLVFIAPATGTYTFRMGADSLSTWQNEDTEFALHVAHFPWGENRGVSVAQHRARRRDVKPFAIERSLRMTAGEELAFIVGSDSPGYIRGGWDNFRVDIGQMVDNK